MAKKVIYISGPITHNPDYKRDFNKVENELIVKGYTVLNPSKLPQGLTNEQYTRIDFAMIDAADAVVLLPGWQESQGARLEVDYCRYIDKPVFLSVTALTGKEDEANAFTS